MNLVKLKEIEKLQEETRDEFDELMLCVNMFIDDPKVSNKGVVRRAGVRFTNKKNKLFRYIYDFWCKYE